MSSPKAASKMRKRSKSIHTSVPFSLEGEEKPNESSDEEGEVPKLDQSNSGSGADDNGSDGWSSSDEQELVQNIRQFTSKSDKLKYTTRVHRLDWSKIAFRKYSPKECQQRFGKYLKMVRPFRTLHEILFDVEEEIKRIPFKKPLNSYQLFVQDQLSKAKSSGDFANKMRNLAELYKNLSPDEREKYEKKSKEAHNDYNKHKMEYLAEKNPDNLKTPFFLFSEYWKLKDIKLNATQLKHKYEELTQNEKYKWVEKAVKLNQGISVTSFLNKDEQRLYRGLPKSVGTPYSMFVKDMYAKVKQSNGEGGKNVFTEIAQEWKNLSVEEKEKYKKACEKLKQVALSETQAINEKFGVKVSKRKSVASKSKKHKSSELVESDDDDKKDEIHKPPTKQHKKSKKRKISTSESAEEPNDAKRVKKEKLSANEKEFASPAPITSTPHIKSKKRNNTVTSEDTADDNTTAPKYMVQIPLSQADDQSDTSNEKKKKKKKDKLSEKQLNKSIHDSEAEISTSSSVSVGKKKKKDKSPEKNFNKSLHDSEAEASTSSSVSDGKKNKKSAQQQSNEILLPGERPPSTVLEYYAKCVYSGKPHKVQRTFEKLSQKEKKELTAQHNEKVEKYVGQLKSYLGSLTKEEALLYVARLKAENNNESQVY